MQLRYFFDPGSGICVWAGDDEAREAFQDYPIALEQLPLSQETVNLGEALIARFDTSIDWSYPPNPSPWSSVERGDFLAESDRFYEKLVVELGPKYEVLCEVRA